MLIETAWPGRSSEGGRAAHFIYYNKYYDKIMLNNFFSEGGSEVNPAQNIITSHTLLKSPII